MISGLGGLAVCVYHWRSTFFANVAPPRVRRTLVILFVAGTLLACGIVLTVPGMSLTTSVLLLLAIVTTAVVAYFPVANTYIRPGNILAPPVLVRYWPSWVIVDKALVVHETAVLRFGLTESSFDLRLAVPAGEGAARPDGRSQRVALSYERSREVLEVLRSKPITRTFHRLPERAMVESGELVEVENVRLQITCNAPGCEPQQAEVKTDLSTLVDRGVQFVFMPKEAGRKVVLFTVATEEGVVKASISVTCEVRKSASRLLSRALIISGWVAMIFGALGAILQCIRYASELIKK
jgi:hypothetical protein